MVLSLCDHSGAWAAPWRAAGHEVRCLDLKRGEDIRLLEFIRGPVEVILCAPPCTDFTVSGAQYWPAKDADGRTLASLALVDACLRAVALYQPRVWALENPVGRLRRWLGPPADAWDPCDFGGWLAAEEASGPLSPPQDAYTKKTLLWGRFAPPERRPVEPVRECAQGSWLMKLGGKSERTKELRSVTPLGFARAFHAANAGGAGLPPSLEHRPAPNSLRPPQAELALA